VTEFVHNDQLPKQGRHRQFDLQYSIVTRKRDGKHRDFGMKKSAAAGSGGARLGRIRR
jgi:hypothetical protein